MLVNEMTSEGTHVHSSIWFKMVWIDFSITLQNVISQIVEIKSLSLHFIILPYFVLVYL